MNRVLPLLSLAVLLLSTAVLAGPTQYNEWHFEQSGLSSSKIPGENPKAGIFVPHSTQITGNSHNDAVVVHTPGRIGQSIFMNDAYFLVLEPTSSDKEAYELFDLNADQVLHVAFWFKPYSTKKMTILSKMENSQKGWLLAMRSTGHLRFTYANSMTSSEVFNVNTKDAMKEEQWVHIQVLFRPLSAQHPKDVVAIYLNGKQADTVLTHASIPDNAWTKTNNKGVVVVGARGAATEGSTCAGPYMTAQIDELMMQTFEGSVTIDDVVISPEMIAEVNAETDVNVETPPVSIATACASNPCDNGLCSDYKGSFTCICQPGWSGKTCSDAVLPELTAFQESLNARVDWSTVKTDYCSAYKYKRAVDTAKFTWQALDQPILLRRFLEHVNRTSDRTYEEADDDSCGNDDPDYDPREAIYNGRTSYNTSNLEYARVEASSICDEVLDTTLEQISKVPDDFQIELPDVTKDFLDSIMVSIGDLLPDDSEEKEDIATNVAKGATGRRLQQFNLVSSNLQNLGNDVFRFPSVNTNTTLNPVANVSDAWNLLDLRKIANISITVDTLNPVNVIEPIAPVVANPEQKFTLDSGFRDTTTYTRTMTMPICLNGVCNPFNITRPDLGDAVLPPALTSMTAQDIVCMNYRKQVSDLGKQRLYRDVPVSQFYVKRVCLKNDFASFTIRSLSDKMAVVIHRFDLSSHREVEKRTMMAHHDPVTIRWRETSFLPRCSLIVVRPLSEVHVGTIDVELNAPLSIGADCPAYACPSRAVLLSKHMLVYNEVELNSNNIQTSIRSRNLLQVALTRKSYDLRDQHSVPILGFSALGSLVAMNFRGGVGNQGMITFNHVIKSVAVLGPIDSNLVKLDSVIATCSASSITRRDLQAFSGFDNIIDLEDLGLGKMPTQPFVCRDVTATVRMNKIPKVNILINDIDNDGDNDDLGAELEAQLCTCDPENERPLCPPGSFYYSGQCLGKSIEEPIIRWWDYCADRKNAFMNGDQNIDSARVHELFSDTDGDGLEDGVEVLGAQLNPRHELQGSLQELVPGAMMVNLMNMNPLQKDVIVEVDMWLDDGLGDMEMAGAFYSDVGVPYTSDGANAISWRSGVFQWVYDRLMRGSARNLMNPNGHDGLRPHFDVGFEPFSDLAEMNGTFARYTEYGWEVNPIYCVQFVAAAGIRPNDQMKEQQRCREAVEHEVLMYKEGVFGDWGGMTQVSAADVSAYCNRVSKPVTIFDEVANNALECVEAINKISIRHRGSITSFRSYRTDFMRYGIGTWKGGGVANTRVFEYTMRGKSAHVLAHELGHTLGLGHGGPLRDHISALNCNPFHLSMMNYMYSYHEDIAYFQPPDAAVYDYAITANRLPEFGTLPFELPDDLYSLLNSGFKHGVGKNFTGDGSASFDWNADGRVSIDNPTGAALPTVYPGTSSLSLLARDAESFAPMEVHGHPNLAASGCNAQFSDSALKITQDATVGAPAIARLGERMYVAYIKNDTNNMVTIRNVLLGDAEDLDCRTDLGEHYGPYIRKWCGESGSSASVQFPDSLTGVTMVQFRGRIEIFAQGASCTVYRATSVSVSGPSVIFGPVYVIGAVSSCAPMGLANYPKYHPDGSVEECIHLAFKDSVTHNVEVAHLCESSPLSLTLSPLSIPEPFGAITLTSYPVPGYDAHLHPEFEITGVMLYTKLDREVVMYGYNQQTSSWGVMNMGRTVRACPTVRLALGFDFFKDTNLNYIHPSKPGKFWFFYGSNTNGICWEDPYVRPFAMWSRSVSSEDNILTTNFGFSTANTARFGDAWTHIDTYGGLTMFHDTRVAVPKTVLNISPLSTKTRRPGVRYVGLGNGVSKDTLRVYNDFKLMAAALCRPLRCDYQSYDPHNVHFSFITADYGCPGTSEDDYSYSPWGY